MLKKTNRLNRFQTRYRCPCHQRLHQRLCTGGAGVRWSRRVIYLQAGKMRYTLNGLWMFTAHSSTSSFSTKSETPRKIRKAEKIQTDVKS